MTRSDNDRPETKRQTVCFCVEVDDLDYTDEENFLGLLDHINTMTPDDVIARLSVHDCGSDR